MTVSGGPGWWQASDLKWYPPERHPQYNAALPPPPPPPEPRSHAAAPVSPTGPRRLSEAERAQILDVALLSRAPVRTTWIDGQVYRSGPRIRRSTTSAEVMWAARVTHPARILLDLLYSFITCGIYMPFWFFLTFRKPKVQHVTIDEYGNQLWRNESIRPLQRVLSVAVLLLMLWWIPKVDGYWPGGSYWHGGYSR